MAQVVFANERTAAKAFDMRPAEFRALVEDGTLPRPRKIGSHERWDMDELTKIVRGERVTNLQW